mmetsp:Transcript_13905/g.19911  ORF Transcript_13905/g.19911 Transcript_13905/m.19911 type:complete len:187 (+) Transcript_13905:152-712(+)
MWCSKVQSLIVQASRRMPSQVLVVGDRHLTKCAAAIRPTRNFVSIADKPLIPGVGLGKTSTGLTGLAVDHDAVRKIIAGNQALLDKMAASDMPETAQYRINVEAIARYRIKVCEENFDDPEKIEELVECGQVEELVLQARDEMEVLDMYLESRLWEKISPNEVEWDWDPNPMEEHSWNLNGQEKKE